MLDWLYSRRDPVSAALALALLAGGALWSSQVAQQARARPDDAVPVMRVALEAPPPDAVPVPPPPAPPPPRPVPPTPLPAPMQPAPLRPQPPQPATTPSPSAQATPAAQSASQPAAQPASQPAAPSAPAPAAAPAPQPAAPASLAPASPVARHADGDASYTAQLRAYLESIKRYPTGREARQTRPVGTVRLWLVIDRAGQLVDCGVDQGSGSLLLDAEARRSVRAGSYPAFPADAFNGAATHRFTVDLDYRVEG